MVNIHYTILHSPLTTKRTSTIIKQWCWISSTRTSHANRTLCQHFGWKWNSVMDGQAQPSGVDDQWLYFFGFRHWFLRRNRQRCAAQCTVTKFLMTTLIRYRKSRSLFLTRNINNLHQCPLLWRCRWATAYQHPKKCSRICLICRRLSNCYFDHQSRQRKTNCATSEQPILAD